MRQSDPIEASIGQQHPHQHHNHAACLLSMVSIPASHKTLEETAHNN